PPRRCRRRRGRPRCAHDAVLSCRTDPAGRKNRCRSTSRGTRGPRTARGGRRSASILAVAWSRLRRWNRAYLFNLSRHATFGLALETHRRCPTQTPLLFRDPGTTFDRRTITPIYAPRGYHPASDGDPHPTLSGHPHSPCPRRRIEAERYPLSGHSTHPHRDSRRGLVRGSQRGSLGSQPSDDLLGPRVCHGSRLNPLARLPG